MPTTPSDALLNELAQRSFAKLVHSDGRILDGSLEETFTRAVQQSPVLKLHDELRIPTEESSVERFRSQDVELLLDQAAPLLAQAVLDRQGWQSAGEKWANLALQLFKEVFALRSDATSIAGQRLAVAARDEQLEAEKPRQEARRACAPLALETVERTDPRQQWAQKQAGRAGMMEYLRTACGADGPPHPRTRADFWFTRQVVDGGWDAQDPDAVTYGIPGPPHIPDALSIYAQRFHLSNAKTSVLSAIADQKRLDGDVTAGDHVLRALTQERDALDSSTRALEERHATDRHLLFLKLKWHQDSELLGFEKQAIGYKLRYSNAAVLAYERLQVAAKGLRALYDFRVELPALVVGRTESFDEVFVWAREALAFLAALESRSQAFTIRVSLRERIGSAWPSAWQPSQTLSFDLTARDLPIKGSNVRIRGVGAELPLSSDLSGRLSMIATAPRQAEGQVLPPCALTRVRAADRSNPSQEVFAQRLWWNASPFGDWQLVINTPGDAPPSDLYFDVHVTCVS